MLTLEEILPLYGLDLAHTLISLILLGVFVFLASNSKEFLKKKELIVKLEGALALADDPKEALLSFNKDYFVSFDHTLCIDEESGEQQFLVFIEDKELLFMKNDEGWFLLVITSNKKFMTVQS